jgi:trehalose synthase
MEHVRIEDADISSYGSVAGVDTIEKLFELARPLHGKRVIHLNATPTGGGVAEILKSEIPLLRSLGIDAQWWALEADRDFFAITKRMHNGLQGDHVTVSDTEWECYLDRQRENARDLPEADLIVVHDPQPMAMPALASERARSWIWRLHVDSSSPSKPLWKRLHAQLAPYDATVFTMDIFAPPDVPGEKLHIIAPAIDPLTPKNRSLPLSDALVRLANIGIDPARPLMSQIARLDVWKDPWGVIDAYRIVKRRLPEVQLALLGVIEAQDDPEALGVYESVKNYAGGDPDVHIFIDPEIIGECEVAAVQTLSQVVLQKSRREGFGLSVAEALWKATPVIGGRVGGIPLQIQTGIGGFLVDSPEEAAHSTLAIFDDPPEARVVAARGRDHVRQNFLITRLIHEELELYGQVLDP